MSGFETVREDQKAEFINGGIVVQSPAKLRHTDVKARGRVFVGAEKTLEQCALAQDRYELATKSRTGALASVAIPGFEIPVRAVFNEYENLRTLKRILA